MNISAPSCHVPALRQVVIINDHAAPLANSGDFALIDAGDIEPSDGDLFLTITDKGTQVVVGLAHTTDGWFARCPNRRRQVVGPMSFEFLHERILGRVVGFAKMIDRSAGARAI